VELGISPSTIEQGLAVVKNQITRGPGGQLTAHPSPASRTLEEEGNTRPMLDLKTIREHTESVKEGIRSKAEDPARIDEILTLDEKRRQLVQHSESLKSRKNTVSADVAALKAKKEDATALIEDMRAVADEIKTIDTELAGTEEMLRAVLLTIPNIPHPSVPIGKGPAENKVIAEWGDDTPTDSALRPHWELMEKLKIIDFARGTKITGRGFPSMWGKARAWKGR